MNLLLPVKRIPQLHALLERPYEIARAPRAVRRVVDDGSLLVYVSSGSFWMGSDDPEKRRRRKLAPDGPKLRVSK